ncbi:MAG: NAD-dependent epimerase/dehydratase family protein [Candidatus Aminicenantaceae bacterium]
MVSENKINNVLVIGGAGYIGSIIVKNLLKENFTVRVLDSLIFGYQPLEIFFEDSHFEFIKGDFRNIEDVVKSIKDMDAVIHLGAIVGDPACNIDNDLSSEINTAATMLIGKVCKGYGVNKFIFASTCSVYGATDEIINEESALNPVSIYARSKIEAEKAILSLNESYFSPTILRIATAFGKSYRQRFDLVVNLLTAKALKEGKISIYNGFQWRPFIHIEDISRAILLLLEAPIKLVGAEIFNVGSNHMNYHISDLGNRIKDLIPETEIEHIKKNEDPRNYRVSFDKIKKVIGFSCQRNLEDGINEIKDVFEKGSVSDYRDSIYNNCDLIKELIAKREPSPFKIIL